MYEFTDDAHALRAGMALGAARKAGLHVHPVYDDDGNYTAAFDVLVFAGQLIRVVVE